MKTENIIAAFRNAASPAARLAHWQRRGPLISPLPRMLQVCRAAMSCKYSPAATLREARDSLARAVTVELSSPENPAPYLWLSSKNDPECLDATPGREFLDHRGWFTDDYQDETVETYAVRLTRFPQLVFYAVNDSCAGGLRVHLDEWNEIDYSNADSNYGADSAREEAASEIIFSNDRTTEDEAEESREFYRKDQVETDIAENRETLKGIRHDIRDLCHELKALCPSPLASSYPAALKAVKDSLAALLRERRELMAMNRELAASLA